MVDIELKERKSKTKIFESAVIIIFFFAFVLSLSKPVEDPDLFWHLKTGEWIWQYKSLPDENPFSFTAQSHSDESSTMIALKQYWLAQLVIYGFYLAGRFYGIVILRCLIYFCIIFVLYLWIKKKGVSRLSSILFLIPPVYFSTIWFGERPNNISFLFAVIVLYLLEEMKNSQGSPGKLIRLPLIMLLWANMHGSFIFGIAIIGLHIVSESMRILRHKGKGNGVYAHKSFFIVGILSALICLINPNTYKVIPVVIKLKESISYRISSEMLTTIAYAKAGDYRGIIIIGAAVLPLLLKFRHARYYQFINYLFFTCLALHSERYIPFLVFTSPPVIAELWGKSLDKISKKTENFYIPGLIISAFMIILFLSNFKATIFRNPVISTNYPEESVKFIKEQKPEGELLNDYNNGGFLLWSLWPEYRVFIDSRGLLYESVLPAYEKALHWGSLKDAGGVPEWKKILSEYKINSILIPPVDIRNTGSFMRLVRRLVEDNEWEIVFMDKEVILFIKNTEKNSRIIKTYSQPKVLAYAKAIEQAELFMTRQPNDWRIYITLGEINLYLRRPKVALLYFESAIKLNPVLQSGSLVKLTDALRNGKDYEWLMDKIFIEPY